MGFVQGHPATEFIFAALLYWHLSFINETFTESLLNVRPLQCGSHPEISASESLHRSAPINRKENQFRG